MELEPNMYVRTKYGYIARLKIINKTDRYTEYEFDNKIGYDYDGFFHSIVEDCIDDIEIIKASYNIIDLIEVGDYVNGSKVYYCYCADEDSTGLFIDTEKGRQWLDNPSQVKSIVTKEQFESMEYKVGD